MVDPFIGEIRMFGFGRAPSGWLPCDGRTVPISQYDSLYTLLGTTFGGDGEQSFGLPDMRGRIPVHRGRGPSLSNYDMGAMSGDEAVTLTVPQLGAHTHVFQASKVAGTLPAPAKTAVLAGLTPNQMYQPDGPSPPAAPLAPTTVTPTGGGAPHNNLAPTLSVNFCIAFEGIYPSQG